MYTQDSTVPQNKFSSPCSCRLKYYLGLTRTHSLRPVQLAFPAHLLARLNLTATPQILIAAMAITRLHIRGMELSMGSRLYLL